MRSIFPGCCILALTMVDNELETTSDDFEFIFANRLKIMELREYNLMLIRRNCILMSFHTVS